MPKSYFLPNNEPGKRDWLNNFSGKLPTYAATVGVTPAEVTQETADALFFTYVCNMHYLHTQTTRDWTAYKHQAAHGDNLGDIPVTPDPGTPPPTVPPDIFGRAAKLAVRIKKHPKCTEAIAQDLGIIGAEVIVDPTTYQPILTLSLNAGHPHIGWPKQGMDSLELLDGPRRRQGFGAADHHDQHGLRGQLAAARLRHERGLEIQGRLSPQRPASRPMERRGHDWRDGIK